MESGQPHPMSRHKNILDVLEAEIERVSKCQPSLSLHESSRAAAMDDAERSPSWMTQDKNETSGPLERRVKGSQTSPDEVRCLIEARFMHRLVTALSEKGPDSFTMNMIREAGKQAGGSYKVSTEFRRNIKRLSISSKHHPPTTSAGTSNANPDQLLISPDPRSIDMGDDFTGTTMTAELIEELRKTGHVRGFGVFQVPDESDDEDFDVFGTSNGHPEPPCEESQHQVNRNLSDNIMDYALNKPNGSSGSADAQHILDQTQTDVKLRTGLFDEVGQISCANRLDDSPAAIQIPKRKRKRRARKGGGAVQDTKLLEDGVLSDTSTSDYSEAARLAVGHAERARSIVSHTCLIGTPFMRDTERPVLARDETEDSPKTQPQTGYFQVMLDHASPYRHHIHSSAYKKVDSNTNIRFPQLRQLALNRTEEGNDAIPQRPPVPKGSCPRGKNRYAGASSKDNHVPRKGAKQPRLLKVSGSSHSSPHQPKNSKRNRFDSAISFNRSSSPEVQTVKKLRTFGVADQRGM